MGSGPSSSPRERRLCTRSGGPSNYYAKATIVGEVLPYDHNRVTLSAVQDRFGLPASHPAHRGCPCSWIHRLLRVQTNQRQGGAGLDRDSKTRQEPRCNREQLEND